MRITRLTTPESFISLQEAKDHLNVDDSDHDAKITALIAAAIGYIDGPDGILGRALAPAQYRMDLAGFPSSQQLLLPLPPTILVESVDYLNENGDRQVFEQSGNWRVVGLAEPGQTGAMVGARVVLDPVTGVAWPSVQSGRDPDTVRVVFWAGYQNADSPTGPAVPDSIKHAVLLMLGDWYDHRSSSVVGTTAAEMPFSAMALLAPYRTYLARRG